ncbi:hypothetical protein ACJRO7_008973 [Eucalyptus globulus]|uniref:Uncharacterized protein n=1 Tax=Eucalyptus globulus TaxID=34317 RepID=A0ABD3ITE8_EUCGL
MNRDSHHIGGVHLDRDFASRKACRKMDSEVSNLWGKGEARGGLRSESRESEGGGKVIHFYKFALPLFPALRENRRLLSRGVVGNSRRAENFELSCRTRQAGRAPPDLGVGIFFGFGVPAGLSGLADSNPSRVN